MSEEVFLGALSLVCGTVVFLSCMRVFAGHLQRRAERFARAADPLLMERLARIELAVEATAVEVERIAESNRFVARLLSEREGQVVLPRTPPRVITPH